MEISFRKLADVKNILREMQDKKFNKDEMIGREVQTGFVNDQGGFEHRGDGTIIKVRSDGAYLIEDDSRGTYWMKPEEVRVLAKNEKNFQASDQVEVADPSEGDTWNHSFTGFIIDTDLAAHPALFQVEDNEEDTFWVKYDQLTRI